MPGQTAVKRALLAFTPVLAIVVGWRAAVHAGISSAAFLPNLIGLVVGCCFIFRAGVVLKLLNTYPIRSMSLVVGGVSLTLLGPGIEGVQRWLPLGPLHFHPGYILTPFAVFLLFSVKKDSRRLVKCLGLILTFVFYWQPDAALATSWNLIFIGALLKDLRNGYVAIFLIIALIIVTAKTWTQHDPLIPVPEVESIFSLIKAAGSVDTTMAIVAGLLLASPLLSSTLLKDENKRPFHVAMMVYSVLLFVTPLLGNFPVPVFGAGISPVIGWYAALALSARQKEF